MEQREILFEYGFQSINGIVKKTYHLHEIPTLVARCDVWDILPLAYVRQFAGLLDRNGVKIFEGDILDWDHCGTTDFAEWMKDAAYYVTYEDGYRLCGKGLKHKGERRQLYLHAFRFKYCSVIGNIHQNADLL